MGISENDKEELECPLVKVFTNIDKFSLKIQGDDLDILVKGLKMTDEYEELREKIV